MRFAAAAFIVAISGFIALSLEMVWFRAFAFVSKSSPAIFGLLLGCFLLGIALGSRASRRWCVDQGAAGDPGQLRTIAGFFLLANTTGFLVLPATAWLATLGIWGVAFLPVAVSAGMMGAILPLVSHYAIKPDDRAGSALSRLYVSNIVGSALGSFLTGCILMDIWGLATIQFVLLMVGLAGAACLTLASGSGWRDSRLGWAGAIALGAILLHSWLHGGLYERLQLKDEYQSGQRFADVLENRHGVITVTRDGEVSGGGAYDGVFSIDMVDDRNWIRRAYLLAALREAHGDVLMVGLSSGSWAQVLVHMPGVKSLTIIEINPGYIELIRKRPVVSGLLENDKVKIIIDDGRRWLQRNPDRRFDLIVQNTTWHWRANCTNLLSEEYLDMCRAHMHPGGILYYNTTFSKDAMLTGAQCFAHALRIFNFMAVSDAPLEWDQARLESSLRSYRIEGRPALDLAQAEHQKRFEWMLALEATLSGPPINEGLESRAALLKRLDGATRITDDNMICEWRRLHW